MSKLSYRLLLTLGVGLVLVLSIRVLIDTRNSEKDPSAQLGPAVVSDEVLSDANILSVVNGNGIGKDVVRERDARQIEVLGKEESNGESETSKILFGDLHVHTTYSDDAFFLSLPLMQGTSGIRPAAAACNYARYVSQLDFFAVTDHAESYVPSNWKASVDALRMCDAVSQKSDAIDVIPFIGYEWTAIGRLPDDHFGHHNVIFRGLDNEELPTRPIAYDRYIWRGAEAADWGAIDADNLSRYEEFRQFIALHKETADCPKNGNSKAFPADCFEYAKTPGELFRKLDEWGVDALVIPHGMAWGFSAPLEVSWKNSLTRANLDNSRMPLIEIYSGHGNSGPYRDIATRKIDENGEPSCPEPSSVYLPACWQAGIIVSKACREEGRPIAECAELAALARNNFIGVNTGAGWLTVPSATYGHDIEKWLDAGQVRDMFLPPSNYRPKKSAQAGLALTNLEQDGQQRFVWGFIGSTDTHRAKAGHGFKQYRRATNIDNGGGINQESHALIMKPTQPVNDLTIAVKPNDKVGLQPFGGIEAERAASFLYLGGLAAVHADGRNRDEIWDAMMRRETYATSGPRILLWFDLVDEKGKKHPMGSEVQMKTTPNFVAKAAGSLEQLPGCDPRIVALLTRRGLDSLAEGECYNPSKERRSLDRLEIVKITRQTDKQQTYRDLIEDPWKVIDCFSEAVCQAEFSDDGIDRDSLYYVRAIEVATPTINGAQLRTRFDVNGRAIDVDPCYAGYLSSMWDDCLAPAEQRAWSSPIYINIETE
jgi:hypothetical protein